MHVLWPSDEITELWGVRAACPYGYHGETRERVAIFLDERKARDYVKAAFLRKPGVHGAFRSGTVLRGYDGYEIEAVEGVPVDPEI